MTFLYYIISFLLIINIIVFVHEYGHYAAAKAMGVKVIKFSLGMGPELFGKTDKDGTRWSFSLLPIGGYVMMLGDGDISSSTSDTESLTKKEKSQTLNSKNNWQQMFVAFAGPFANYAYAFIVLFFLASSAGIPVNEPIIGSVVKNSPAEYAGLIHGDKILSVNNENVKNYREIASKISSNEKAQLDLIVLRDGTKHAINITPKIIEKKKLFGGTKKTYFIGLKAAAPIFKTYSPLESIIYSFTTCVNTTVEMFSIFGNLFAGKKSFDDFGGVVHMASVSGDLVKNGNFALLILFTVTLSLNLGFINLLPLPVLDGGRILICLLQQIFRKKINTKIQEYIMMVFAILLIALMLITTANDILRFETVNNFVAKIFG